MCIALATAAPQRQTSSAEPIAIINQNSNQEADGSYQWK